MGRIWDNCCSLRPHADDDAHIKPQEIVEGAKVVFTYDVYWQVRMEEVAEASCLPEAVPHSFARRSVCCLAGRCLLQDSKIKWASRWDAYLRMPGGASGRGMPGVGSGRGS
jgi:transmembrane 9 superfamily protein 2/4